MPPSVASGSSHRLRAQAHRCHRVRTASHVSASACSGLARSRSVGRPHRRTAIRIKLSAPFQHVIELCQCSVLMLFNDPLSESIEPPKVSRSILDRFGLCNQTKVRAGIVRIISSGSANVHEHPPANKHSFWQHLWQRSPIFLQHSDFFIFYLRV